MEKIADIGEDFFQKPHILRNPGGVSALASNLVSNILVAAGVVLIFIIVYSGFIMVTGAGDPQSFEKAKSTLTAGIIGFIIVVAAWFITRIIETSTGVNILQ